MVVLFEFVRCRLMSKGCYGSDLLIVANRYLGCLLAQWWGEGTCMWMGLEPALELDRYGVYFPSSLRRCYTWEGLLKYWLVIFFIPLSVLIEYGLNEKPYMACMSLLCRDCGVKTP